MFRSLLFISIAAACVAAAQVPTHTSQVPAGTDETSKVTVFRNASRLVNVNVVVTDRHDQPVRGLHEGDFEIFDDGKPQKVAFFSTLDDERAGSGAHALAPGVYTNDPHRLGIADSGVTVILFDTVNTDFLSQAYSLGKIRIFLRQLHSEDRVGIYVLSENGLKLVYDPTQPASTLLQEMKRYDEAHAKGSGSKGNADLPNSTGLVELDRFLQGKEHRPMYRCDPMRFPVTIAAFQEIARSSIAFNGRKAVIWVTEHMPLPYGEENAFDLARGSICGLEPNPNLILEEPSNLKLLPSSHNSRSSPVPTTENVLDRGLSENDELDILLRLLNQNNIALYPVSAEGLQTVRLFGPTGMDANAAIGGPAQMTQGAMDAVDTVANVATHQDMQQLARFTGGRAFYNRNDLETGIRRSLDDAKYSYELAYYPDHDHWNGDWRSIKVKVNLPGGTVLTRGGYYAFPEPKPLPPKAREQLLKEVADSPLEATAIPVTVKIIPPPRSPEPSMVEASVYLSAQNLFTSQLGVEWKSDFEVLFFQLASNNAILDVTTQNVSVELTPARYGEALKRGINTSQKLQLKPGAALLHVIVRNKRSDAVGSVRIPLAQDAVALRR
jgi:VWFA-related protein